MSVMQAVSLGLLMEQTRVRGVSQVLVVLVGEAEPPLHLS